MIDDKSKGTILIVDDDTDILEMLFYYLQNHGFKALVAENGTMAIERAIQAQPDIILLDVMMPGINGFETCRRLKENEVTEGIPVIFLSVLTEPMDKVTAFKLGAVDYITKPFSPAEILARINVSLTVYNVKKSLDAEKADLEQENVRHQAALKALKKARDESERRVKERTVELAKLISAYGRFVPYEILQFLNKESILDVNLGDYAQLEMTIFSSDIRSFTTLSENMTPQQSFEFLNAYLSRVNPIIRQHNGFIDKYIGDGILALFSEKAEDAVQAAINIRQEITGYNKSLAEQGYPPIKMGIGIHTGKVMLGTIGDEDRMDGTVISDAVNLASRIEGLNRLYGASIVISEHSLYKLPRPAAYHFRFLDRVQVKGKSAPVSVFEIFDGDSEAVIDLKLKTRTDFEKGLLHYHSEEFAESQAFFKAVLDQNPEDEAASLFLQRAARYMRHGAPSDWKGIEALTEK